MTQEPKPQTVESNWRIGTATQPTVNIAVRDPPGLLPATNLTVAGPVSCEFPETVSQAGKPVSRCGSIAPCFSLLPSHPGQEC
jgi:hypothetical protein